MCSECHDLKPALYRLPDVFDRLIPSLALRKTAGKSGYLGHEVSGLILLYMDMTFHVRTSINVYQPILFYIPQLY